MLITSYFKIVELQKFAFAKEAEQKGALKETIISTHIPHYMERFSKATLLHGGESGPFLLGAKITYADILLANVLDTIETTVDPDAITCYPVMKTLKDAVFDIPNIKEYVEKRA
jgi:glutathione S-transferase